MRKHASKKNPFQKKLFIMTVCRDTLKKSMDIEKNNTLVDGEPFWDTDFLELFYSLNTHSSCFCLLHVHKFYRKKNFYKKLKDVALL